MKDNKSNNRKFSEWLENLQQESWQLELLISGFVIYGLFSAKPYINEVTNFLMASNDLTLFIGALISASLPLAWYVFVSNLIIHVFVRGLWIGSVGLRYVSGDIDYSELRYNKVFEDYYNKKYGSFDNFIEKLEKISSIIFSITFLIFFIFLSTLIYIGILIYLVNHTVDGSTFVLFRILGGLLLGLLLFSGLLIVLDFFTLGGLKRIKNKWFSKMYFRLNKITTTITLTSLWRPLLLNFLDHKFSRMVFLLSLPYALFVSIFLPNLFIHADVHHPDFHQDTVHNNTIAGESYNYHYYEDELRQFFDAEEEIVLSEILLPSKKIKGRLIEVFVKSHPTDKSLITHLNPSAIQLYQAGLKNTAIEGFKAGLDKDRMDTSGVVKNANLLNKEDFSQNLKSIKRTLNNVKEFAINDEVIDRSKVACDFYMHPINQTKGMLCIIQIDTLPIGRNKFTLKRLIGSPFGPSPVRETQISIPFIYEE